MIIYLAKVDVLLTDSECEKGVAEKVEAQGGLVVSSEWIIHVSSNLFVVFRSFIENSLRLSLLENCPI